MKLLVITQKMDRNDPILGFFHSWVEEFAKHFEKVTVICLEEGKHSLPASVVVLSLGKEEGTSRLKYIFKFYKYIYIERKNYDVVFVHMNQIYVVLGGLLWRIWSKRIGLWYVHRATSTTLWIAEKLADIIFTSSKESFRLESNKIVYVGHGVDSTRFLNQMSDKKSDNIKIVHVGRITPIKNLETLLIAGEMLSKKIPNLTIDLIGNTSSQSDEKYLEVLKNMVKEKFLENIVFFKGSVQNTEIANVYGNASLSVNLSPTGGWDKVIIESLMTGCPTFTSNTALQPVFGEYSSTFIFGYRDALDLANKISNYLDDDNRDKVIDNLRGCVIKEYDIKNLIKKISDKLQ